MNHMHSFMFRAVGNLARNPEALASGDIVYVRFCLVGTDHAEPDDEVDRARDVVTSVWFMAFDKIGDDLLKNGRKGDQLNLEARVRAACRASKDGSYHCENVFIVTGFQYGARKGDGRSSSTAMKRRPPDAPTQTEAVAEAVAV